MSKGISRGLLIVVTLNLLAAGSLSALSAEGFVSLGAFTVDAKTSWRDGGFGRLDLGEAGGEGAEAGIAEAHLLLQLAEGGPLGLVVQGALRDGPAENESRAAGIAQAFGRYHREFGDQDGDSRVGLRLGFFFLPTSRENTEVGWSSPYTLTFSALNSWIGEEVRPTGFEASYSRRLGAGDLKTTALVFGGNDASGALLAWRGFVMSSRVALWGEKLPLPPLQSLQRDDQFGLQRDDGSQSFGEDLDGRAGHFFALRYELPERLVLQVDSWDNRGDRRLHQGEYAWATSFRHAAAEWRVNPRLIVLGEWMDGKTGMGLLTTPHVDVDFEVAYLLASWQQGPFRLSLRRDEFELVDRDGTTEPNGEEGNANTAALFYDSPSKAWRFGLEWLELEGDRPAALASGANPEAGGQSLRFEVRYYFGQ